MNAPPPPGFPLSATPLVQPDRRSCGAAVLVVSRMWHDAAFAARVAREGRFTEEVLAMHRRVTGLVDVRGRLQLPWPRALGTPPWAVVHQLHGPHGSGLPGTSYRSVVVLPWRRRQAWQALVAAVAVGHAVPVYVGSRRLPRHVVLALPDRAGAVNFYEPSSGGTVSRSVDRFVSARLGLGGWDVPWFVVVPD